MRNDKDNTMDSTQRMEAALLDAWKRSKQKVGQSTRVVSERQLRNAADRFDAFYLDMTRESTLVWGVDKLSDGRFLLTNRNW